MTPAQIQAALYGAFGLGRPASPPPRPAEPDRFPAILARPAPPASLNPLNPLRLALGGAVSPPKR